MSILTASRGILVLDATLLNHSARADKIDLLGAYLSEYECWTTDVVLDELKTGYVHYPELTRATSAKWISSDPLDSFPAISSFAEWSRRIGASTHHRGEASVFACAELRGGIAITDDRGARKVAGSYHLEAHGTLWLLARLLRERSMTDIEVSHLIDALVASGARLPCNGRSFPAWCQANGISISAD
jgi:predicted nucleic acid-binding protein